MHKHDFMLAIYSQTPLDAELSGTQIVLIKEKAFKGLVIWLTQTLSIDLKIGIQNLTV